MQKSIHYVIELAIINNHVAPKTKTDNPINAKVVHVDMLPGVLVNLTIREKLGLDNDKQYQNEQDRAEIQNLNDMDAQVVPYHREEIKHKAQVKYEEIRIDDKFS